MAEARADRLRVLLEEERAALNAGELDRLDTLLDRKERLAAEIAAEGLGCAAAEAEALRRLAGRNAELLESARAGLRAAMDRIGERSRVARSLDTYDAGGNRRSLGATPGALHRRF
jgi:hypothetical protein